MENFWITHEENEKDKLPTTKKKLNEMKIPS